MEVDLGREAQDAAAKEEKGKLLQAAMEDVD
jgi:hypothetical protein